MSQKLTRAAYRQVIAEDLAWLDRQPDTLEADHIRQILKDSERCYYDVEQRVEVLAQQVEGLRGFLNELSALVDTLRRCQS